ncbi:hypothetical protein ACHAXR_004481 [Thalassiosira sp. AJA248-18]
MIVHDAEWDRLRGATPHGSITSEDGSVHFGISTCNVPIPIGSEPYVREYLRQKLVSLRRGFVAVSDLLATLADGRIQKYLPVRCSGFSRWSVFNPWVTTGFATFGYFFIIDRLFETLDQRIKQWHGPTKDKLTSATKKGRLSNIMPRGINSLVTGLKTKVLNSGEGIEVELRDDIMDERLNVVRCDVKIFDFGLACIMPEGGDPYEDEFEMSGAGSPRYMAPECLRGGQYNMKADVFTFAIVLWEMLSGETPYSFARTRNQLCFHVCQERGRPEIDDSWPSNIKSMLRSSFDDEVHHRPVLQFLRGGDITGLSNAHINRRRSAASVE